MSKIDYDKMYICGDCGTSLKFEPFNIGTGDDGLEVTVWPKPGYKTVFEMTPDDIDKMIAVLQHHRATMKG